MHPIWCLTGGFKHVGPATKRLQRNASLDMLPMATWAKRLFLNESTKKGTFLFNKVYWLVLGLSEKDGRHWQSSNRRQRNPMKPATSCGKPRLMRQGKGLLFPSVVHLPWFRGLDFEAPHNIHTFPKERCDSEDICPALSSPTCSMIRLLGNPKEFPVKKMLCSPAIECPCPNAHNGLFHPVVFVAH